MDDDEQHLSGTHQDPGEVTPENERVQDHWEQTVEDMEATADRYREDGWSVLELHPGDVVALGPERADRWGLDLLVPDPEFDELERWVLEEGHTFESCEVFRGDGSGVIYVVVAMQDADGDRMVLFPAYYDPSRSSEMLEAAREAGEMRTHVRPLTNEPVVTFTQSDPSLFTP